VVGDSEFSRYMRNKRDYYDDGEDVHADPLMSVALAKSHSLIESGVWNMMSPYQERLVALLSEVNMIKDRKLKLSKDTQGGRKGKKPEDKGKFKKGLNTSKKKSDEENLAWKKVPPQAGEPKTKGMPGFGKDHHWCDDHQAWTVQLSEDCELRHSRQQKYSASTSTPLVLRYESEQERELCSLTSMVCIQGILQVWIRLIFLADFLMFENPELVFALLMGPELYDIYLAMMLLLSVIWVVKELVPSWYNPLWVRRKKKKFYKYLSRMKLLMLLTEYWNADNWKCTPNPFRWAHNDPRKNNSYCPRFYAKTKGGAKVKNKGSGAPYPRTAVCEGVRGEVTHEGVPMASECVTVTG
jgi:hypothetical protein